MYIEAIILEGFKSYSNRVYVGPMHPHFNAVTGLNGTGKSNILDAICFVLGITNHSLVRATKLDDLVYKQGQAGVTKATVTIKFRNDVHQAEKSSTLPFPYRDMSEITVTRQIVIGGRDRYLLNSRNAQLKEVRDLFQSCQLNINNPHFLIQQGKITRVVNMKPKELLGLIEEVAGTRLYEYKRATAVKLMQKKDQKLHEIHTVLREEIEPTLERLRKERQEYYTYVSLKEEMQRLERFDIAYRFYCARQHVIHTAKELEALLQKADDLEKQIASKEQQQEELQRLLEQLATERSEQERPLMEVKKKKEEIERLLAKRQSDEKSARRDHAHGKEALEELLREKQRLEKKLGDKLQSRQARADRSVEAEEGHLAAAKQQLLRAEARLQALLQGYSSSSSSGDAVQRPRTQQDRSEGDRRGSRRRREKKAERHGEEEKEEAEEEDGREDGEGGRTEGPTPLATGGGGGAGGASLQEQLRVARTAAATAEATAEGLRAEVQHLTAELAGLQQKTASNAAERERMEKQREEKAHLVQQLRQQQQELQQVDQQRLQYLYDQQRLCARELEAATQEARESLQELEATVKVRVRLPRGVAAEKLYGHVYELIDVKDEYIDLMIPLQLLLGSRLEYIVVEDKEASKAIFQENDFARSRRRVTLLPLQDCQVGKVCDRQALLLNKKRLGLNDADRKVLRCLDVVTYAPHLEKLAFYIFGGALICANSSLARQITFQSDRRLAFPTVTAEGDVFQVGGAMSGGHAGHVAQTLLLWKNYTRCRGMAEQLREKTKQIAEELEPLEKAAQQHAHLSKEILLAENSLRHLEQLFAASCVGSAVLQEEQTKARHAECMQRLQEAEQAVAAAGAEVKRLSDEIYEIEHHREEMEEALKKEVAELRQQIKTKEAQLQSMQQEVSSHRREMQMLRKELESVQEDVNERMGKLAVLQQIVEEKVLLVVEERKQVDEVRKEIEGLLEEAARSDKKKMDILTQIKKAQKARDHLALLHKKHEHAIQDKEKALGDFKEETKALQQSYPWLHAEQAKINQPDSFYDFQQIRPETARQRLHQLQAQVQRMQRTVNSNAAPLLEKTEKDLQALVSRRHRVEEDKTKIEAVISELDVKKRHSLEITWQRVNENFTAIFQQLLPHAQARLGQANPHDLTEGLEICVAFHNKWKESLAELSGGQRSLLALALILALLKVKPAPVYVLDEVDAALDLSHTQNIGSMIKTQFPSSQFIIVSLKEGMFAHADVLFRTRLTDGVSSVERRCLSETAQQAGDQHHQHEHQQQEPPHRAGREAAAAAAEERHGDDVPNSIAALCNKTSRTREGEMSSTKCLKPSLVSSTSAPDHSL